MSEISKLEKNLIIKKIDKETVNIQILDNNILSLIVGEFNTNLKQLEKLTNTTLFFRGNSITAKGRSDNISNVSEAIKFLINKFHLTNNIESESFSEIELLSTQKLAFQFRKLFSYMWQFSRVEKTNFEPEFIKLSIFSIILLHLSSVRKLSII